MLILKKLVLHNFMVFKDEEIDFNNRDVIGILGSYAEGNGRSNMSGKSSIVESIKYLLVGTTRYKKEINLIHYGEKEMWIEGVFLDESNGKEYKLKRGRDHKNSGVLEINWVTGSRDAQIEINSLFGITKEDFELTNYFQQSDIHGFMKLSPTEKTKFLMEWLDNKHWQDKEARVREDIRELKTRVKELETTIKVLSEESVCDLTDLENERDLVFLEKRKIKAKINKLLKNIEVFENEREANVVKLQKSINEREKLVDERLEIKRKKREVINAQQRIKDFNAEIENLKGQLTPVKQSKEKLKSKGMYNSQIIKDKLALLEKFENHNGGICPILNESCDRVACDSKQLNALKTEITALRESNTKIKKSLKSIDDNEKIGEKIDSRRVNIKKCDEQVKSYDVPDGRLEEITSRINQLDEYLKENNNDSVNNKIKKIKREVNDLREEEHEIQSRIGSLTQAIDNRIKLEDKIIENTKKLEEYKQVMGHKLFCATMFGKQGIPSLEIENAFSSIEQDINDNFKYLGSQARISFNPVTELNKKAVSCSCGFVYPKGFRSGECPDCGKKRGKEIKEEISLDIHENGTDSSFEGNSGGGQAIVSFAVRVALTMIKRNQGKCRLNMLFLDEVDSALDSYFSHSIINAVMTLLRDKLGFNQVLIISHNNEIKNILPNTLMVKKDGLQSTAQFLD